MITRLAFRSAAQRPLRTALLLGGYGLGVGVTVALLSIATALLEQARDRELVGGGDLTVLPAGIDLETFRTGGVSSMYFTIEQAPFLYREVLRSARHEKGILSAAPWIDDALNNLPSRFAQKLCGNLAIMGEMGDDFELCKRATLRSLELSEGVVTEATPENIPGNG